MEREKSEGLWAFIVNGGKMPITSGKERNISINLTPSQLEHYQKLLEKWHSL